MVRRVRLLLVAALLMVTGLVLAAGPASAVIGGSKSTYGPWAVRMLIDGKPACTGTAVTKQWIITASHCFFEQGQEIADKRISFRVGDLDMRKGTTVRPVGKRAGNAHADMMLIKVSPMKVRPARLATAHARPGEIVRQYGWGATCTTDENACQSPVLKQSTLRVVRSDARRCEGFAVPGGTDFCMEKVSGIPAGGDSGAPVMTIGAHGKETLLGVFYGSDREKMAGAGEIAQQLAWIHKVTKR
ncbi:S1 family peptidase [Actinoallomurus rhizosphaericola]|uniref:S1 family peptidase n=1 Tax=Actinoallomurus rhizosphaericola TaxID=2952536 RepID=UPI0020927FCF|nr:trypsin-like serine protease [Actinoallomurus rhizosphaericola]MCO5995963.1 trypsin-like serine protease [Actinoallomurus rhizosphaericola]